MSQGLIQHYLPVFRHYLSRIDHLAERGTAAHLSARLSPDGFTALEHFAIAQRYILRGVYPLIGQDLPEMEEVTDHAGLRKRGGFVRSCLDEVAKCSAQNADDITHVAGHSTLRQSPYDYIALYAAPNFFFHMNMGYAILRSQGAQVGKGDFDGFHSYPQGFSFQNDGAGPMPVQTEQQ
ncbi:DUF1993 family protein [Pelagimonas varians]|uniref:DUF1993 domain-containing protein n=1 Tax=Pelagimonas varians TaxID=696760 RepID=A0A238KUJ5_9RHOB|nr:DUF1993 family protein [Pelagimonas varians]PYG28319.1 hypothetical protein C8N36_11294 [Pelagimonas varians]SMX46465.1 hypothetical protein PEV8663_03296 [Pelagimonas varians]